ncbi:hypothetical protein OCU04_003086 [Sclerotinia nivalis]|uniref:Uncharacterized protein n=1 Tax=Sclerotinia nivalis TaxID=352851 RepID=A0A9X0AUZ1_9HELO|nr:hypothetical protein OCU04_003086 [Sclerotinia nivalis]
MTKAVAIALQYPVEVTVGKNCAGVAPNDELACFQKLCPMPGPPGFSCGSVPPQYQLNCYKKRCYEVYTPLAPEQTRQTPSPSQQTPNAAQKTPHLVGGCISVATENQLECYRQNCPMPGSIGYSCGSLQPQYQLQCYKTHCDNNSTPNTDLPVLPTLDDKCTTVAPENREECFQKECFKLFCASLPAQYQLQCYRQHCSVAYISELINGLGDSLGGILDSLVPKEVRKMMALGSLCPGTIGFRRLIYPTFYTSTQPRNHYRFRYFFY